MGTAYYPSFEHPIEGYNPAVEVSGKPIARSMELLDEICDRIGQKTLTSFYSESNAEAYELLGEEPPEDMPAGEPLHWTDPAEGLRTVAALTDYLRLHPDALPNTAAVLDDLKAFRTVFSTALEHGTRFRLRIDI
jgi:hypothetical protein